MAKIHRKYKYLGQNWPGSETILELVKRACGLFIWIHTVYLFLKQRDAGARLKTVLSLQTFENAESELDKLYTKALLDHPDISDSVFYDRFQQIVGGMVVLFDPLSSASLDSLLHLSFHSDDIVLSLQSFLHNTDGDIVRFIHPSFPEFLSDKARCQNDRLRIDRNFQHGALAKACLAKMHETLQKNICDLDSSKLHSDIGDLEEQIVRNISEELQYACQYWAHHLSSMSELDADVLELVKRFFNDNLLHGLEILNLLQKMTLTLLSLDLVLAKLENQLIFVVVHIYDSALPFAPKNTPLYKTYLSKWENHIKVLSSTLLQWSALITVCEGHSGSVYYVAFSPDGSKFVSGSGDTTLCLWEAKSGAAIGKPMKGHSDVIYCVAFSPDGSKIVSGSSDNTCSEGPMQCMAVRFLFFFLT
ncbi:hypothetical protein BD410DRAFT_873727 [Rickenella mellea]|uniref:Uncharacterized protein n=1 Tax=Rickenella mellea TaxID=50990 RepID=A0A4Y7PFI8_9AGAM|nr:hypothetical protein BD410DRAFT_873727 [Rickenella mellea]